MGLQGLETRTYHKKLFCEFLTKKSEKKTKIMPTPTTPRMRKANEKNAKNILNRGNVSKTSKKRGQLSCIPRAFGALHFCCDRIGCLPDCSVYMDVLIGLPTGNPNCLKKKNVKQLHQELLHLPFSFFLLTNLFLGPRTNVTTRGQKIPHCCSLRVKYDEQKYTFT